MVWWRGGDDRRPRKWGKPEPKKTKRPPASPPPTRGKGRHLRGKGDGQR